MLERVENGDSIYEFDHFVSEIGKAVPEDIAVGCLEKYCTLAYPELDWM